MKNRISVYMTIAVLVGFAIIIGMNSINLLGMNQYKYISPNDVRGIAIEHNKLLYTLNFDQQNAVIEMFNRSFPITQEEADSRMKKPSRVPDVQKIVIYRFNAPDIEIKPAGYVTKSYSRNISQDTERYNMLFSAPDWSPNRLLEESTQDQIQEILFQTYDK